MATVARWIEAAETVGLGEVAKELRRANQSAGETMRCCEAAETRLREMGGTPRGRLPPRWPREDTPPCSRKQPVRRWSPCDPSG